MKRDLLNAKKVESAKPGPKDYQLADGAGLYLRVRTTGAKVWLIRTVTLKILGQDNSEFPTRFPPQRNHRCHALRI